MIFKEQWFWWNMLGHFADWVYFGWIWSGIVCAVTRIFDRWPMSRAIASRLHGELRPLYWPAVSVLMIDTMQAPGNPWLKPLAIGLYVWMWYAYKNEGDDDDRWKKRLKKLKEKVAVQSGRLVVTPT